MAKASILTKICLFFVALHGLQISVAIGRSTMRTHYNNQHLEEILNSWDFTDSTEGVRVLTDYYSAQTKLEAFQSLHARHFIYQYILHQEDNGIDRPFESTMIVPGLPPNSSSSQALRSVWAGIQAKGASGILQNVLINQNTAVNNTAPNSVGRIYVAHNEW
ncbi:hypothetical protein IFR04_010650 [Cadophora malorum]|uniref:Uncharacterized protein n=1 Tax=Cadophora malorum TaxID=108018 RepID=A0A8H7TCA6_9HELO|nr:hypothetical protein IFR04_010650 [Cadophora malorum]